MHGWKFNAYILIKMWSVRYYSSGFEHSWMILKDIPFGVIWHIYILEVTWLNCDRYGIVIAMRYIGLPYCVWHVIGTFVNEHTTKCSFNMIISATADVLAPSVLTETISGVLGAVSIRKTVLPGMAIPMLKIRRPNGRLIFNMEIAIRR